MANNGNAEGTKLGVGGSLIYSSAQFGGNLLSMVFTSWILFFYTSPGKGGKVLVSMAIMGAALTVGRIIDAFYDPTIGYWSDNTNTRIGRRRPFIIWGTPLFVASFILLFNPLLPAGSAGLAVLTVFLVSVFWLAFTTVMGPYNALMPEIALTSDERVKISTLLAVMMLLATGYQGIAVPKLIEFYKAKYLAGLALPNLNHVSQSVLDEATRYGYAPACFITGIIAFVTIYITAIFIKEKVHHAHEKYSVGEAFSWTFKNKPFVIYIVASVFQYLGFSSLTAGIPFIVTALMKKPIGFVGTVYMYNIPSFIISFFLINIIAKKTGKVPLYKFCLLLLALLLPLLFFVGNPHLPISPVTAGIGLMVLLGFPISGNMILPTAILADIIDYDEKITKMRREAIYFGMQGLLQKMANAMSQGIQAILFGMFGYTAARHLGINLLGPVAGFFGFIGFIVFLYFPLDEKTKDIKVKA
jgi:glycoside/pentoside/hexuronide:cation symporter, GPH family